MRLVLILGSAYCFLAFSINALAATAATCVPAGTTCRTETDVCCLDNSACGQAMACSANPSLGKVQSHLTGELELPEVDPKAPPIEPCPGDVCQ